jgi:hypothetical protein
VTRVGRSCARSMRTADAYGECAWVMRMAAMREMRARARAPTEPVGGFFRSQVGHASSDHRELRIRALCTRRNANAPPEGSTWNIAENQPTYGCAVPHRAIAP